MQPKLGSLQQKSQKDDLKLLECEKFAFIKVPCHFHGTETNLAKVRFETKSVVRKI